MIAEDPISILFEEAHSLPVDDMRHSPLLSARSGRTRRIGIPTSRGSRISLCSDGTVFCKGGKWNDMDEIEVIGNRWAAYRPAGYAKPLVIDTRGKSYRVYRFVQEAWYALSAGDFRSLAGHDDSFRLSFRPIEGTANFWKALDKHERVVGAFRFEVDGAITFLNQAIERFRPGTSINIISRAGALLRTARSDVTVVGEPIVPPARYFTKQLRLFAFREGQWFELVPRTECKERGSARPSASPA